MAADHLKEIIATLPDTPGIYKYYDSQGKLIYIGKAKSLKKRVSSYFTKQRFENRKTAVMVNKIDKIEFTLVDSEIDALLLENSLIKKFQPRFNINLRDDKTYPFIRITKERFPRIFPTRNPVKDGSEYFGPYASVRMMHTILDLIRNIYPTRNCNFNLSEANIQAGKFKVCLEYQIGNCRGPCEGLEQEDDYNQTIQQVKNILKGNLAEVSRHIKGLMQQASADYNFELAEQYRVKLAILEDYQGRSTIVNKSIHDVDVFSIAHDDRFAFVNFLKVANGMVIQTQTMEYRKQLDEAPEDILSLAIAEVRERYHSTSKEVIVPFKPDIEDEQLQFLVPKQGEKKKLLDLSLKNALYYKKEKLDQYEKLNPGLKTDRLMELMQKDLRLQEWPRHIECIDNSNIQGAYPVSAIVVFKDGKPAKKEYRHFNVRTVEGPNDFATMTEVLERRYKRQVAEGNPLPQLLVIDGGKGQLSAAVEALQNLGLYGQIPVIGIAKKLEEIFYPGDQFPLYIDKRSETLKVIQHMRDEAHRFGITHHRNRRDKGTLKTELDHIKGIGPSTVQALIRELRSVKKIREASPETLEAIIGKDKATKILRYFSDHA